MFEKFELCEFGYEVVHMGGFVSMDVVGFRRGCR